MLPGRAHYAVISGMCASAASFFGKMTSSSSKLVEEAGNVHEQPQNTLIIQITCLVLMALCNALVWTFFVKALQDRGSLIATVTSAATNYCCSAFLGCIVFGETTSILWWFGTTLVIIGMVLVATEPTQQTETIKNTKIN